MPHCTGGVGLAAGPCTRAGVGGERGRSSSGVDMGRLTFGGRGGPAGCGSAGGRGAARTLNLPPCRGVYRRGGGDGRGRWKGEVVGGGGTGPPGKITSLPLFYAAR